MLYTECFQKSDFGSLEEMKLMWLKKEGKDFLDRLDKDWMERLWEIKLRKYEKMDRDWVERLFRDSV